MRFSRRSRILATFFSTHSILISRSEVTGVSSFRRSEHPKACIFIVKALLDDTPKQSPTTCIEMKELYPLLQMISVQMIQQQSSKQNKQDIGANSEDTIQKHRELMMNDWEGSSIKYVDGWHALLPSHSCSNCLHHPMHKHDKHKSSIS